MLSVNDRGKITQVGVGSYGRKVDKRVLEAWQMKGGLRLGSTRDDMVAQFGEQFVTTLDKNGEMVCNYDSDGLRFRFDRQGRVKFMAVRHPRRGAGARRQAQE
jgi:hypothetical protein